MHRRTPRLLFASALLSAVVALAGAAHAEQGTVVLTTGEVLSGDIFEVVNGDHVVIKLADGSVRAVAWVQIGTLQIGAGGQITVHPMGGPGPGPGPGAPPPNGNPPPPVVYAPPPPQPNYGYGYPPPPPPPEPPHRFTPRFQIAARLGSLVPGGNLVGDEVAILNFNVPMTDYVKPGIAIEGDIGLHFARAWTFYGGWELGFLERGDKNANANKTPVSNYLGLGFFFDSNSEGDVGFVMDMGMGYRWLTFPVVNSNGTGYDATYGGLEILRLGLGIGIGLDKKTRLDVMAIMNVGTFTSASQPADQTQCGTSTSGDPNLCNISNHGTHIFYGINAGVHFDL